MLEIKENVPLAPMTTFEISGTARFLVEVRTEDELLEAIRWAREHSVPFILLSGGSNVLVPEYLDALVIRIVGDETDVRGNTLDSWAGTNLFLLIRSLGAKGLGGWEKLAGIPGTIGGAVRGNAGAFGPEIKDFVISVRALNTQTLEFKEFSNMECDFSYRHSFFKDNPDWIVVRVRITLEPVEPEASAALANETIAEREKRHLQNVRAAGSYFMNPVAPANIVKMFEDEKQVKSRESRVPAGWLIEKVGMKGAVVGGAQASPQHPNYIVNTGNATAHEVLELAVRIKKAVKEKFDIDLKEEAAVFVNKF
ncbi:UDP-N-acetylmuramate dehydrogenase [Candidatus Parcubacteria bacterium]|nr:MAG: UDP-N-acetylmuramate dehydrogenase [Candidatus Parcubacteria bacterium]